MNQIDNTIESAKNKIGAKIPCTIEVLTPVHIGSGIKLAKDIDFISTSQTTTIIPQSLLLEYLENNPDEIESFINGEYKAVLNNINNVRKYEIGNVNEIAQFERDVYCNPYIPGSSLKGAIRTALIKKLITDLNPEKVLSTLKNIYNSTNIKKEHASQDLLKLVLGKDSNTNIMRVLQAFDAHFKEVSLERVCLLNLTNQDGTSYGWKNIGRNRNMSDPNDATQIFIETLPIGSKSDFSIHIDDFLLNNSAAKTKLNFQGHLFNNLCSTINSYTLNQLDEEIKFYEGLMNPKKLSSLINNIKTIHSEVNKLVSGTNEFILRLSWGGGWRSMTGNYLDGEALKGFREKYALTRNDFPIFPKTRRIVFQDNIPSYITGFVKIKLNDCLSEEEKSMLLESGAKSNFNETDVKTNKNEILIQKEEPVVHKGKIKKEDIIYAKVIRSEQPSVIVKLFADEYVDELRVRYPSGIPENTIIKVKVTEVQKGKPLVVFKEYIR